jgi:hypothetical protein
MRNLCVDRVRVRELPANSCSCLAILIDLTKTFPKPDTFPSQLPPVREPGSRTGERLSLYERRGKNESNVRLVGLGPSWQ